MEITFGFWFVVFPVMVHVNYVKNATAWAALALAHLIPISIVAVDLYLSSFQFYLRHVIVYFFFGLMYLGYYFIQSFIMLGPGKDPIYPSMDWYKKPTMASLLIAALLIVYLGFCLLMVKVSHIKIRRRFPDGQVIAKISNSRSQVAQQDIKNEVQLDHVNVDREIMPKAVATPSKLTKQISLVS
jgi:hypothetical protein